MHSNIYQACCCFSSYYPYSPYEELDDIKLKNSGEKENLNTIAGTGEEYRSTQISNPSSSSFEAEVSSENEEIAGLSNDLYNTNNLNNQTNANMARKDTTDQDKRAPSVYTIQSDVSVQLSSWQSASHAMAQASATTTGRKKRDSSAESLNKQRSRSSSISRKRSRNGSAVSTNKTHSATSLNEEKVEDSGRYSPLGKLEEATSSRLGLYKSLNEDTNSSSKDYAKIEVEVTENMAEEPPLSRLKIKSRPEKDKFEETVVLKDYVEMTVVTEAESAEDNLPPKVSKSSLISPVMEPIKMLLGVFSGDTTKTAVGDIEEPDEIEYSTSESDMEESSAYSVATSDISSDPTSDDGEDANNIQESFFPELYETKDQNEDLTANILSVAATGKQAARRESWSSRYPVVKQEEDSSSIATDELSETTNELSSVHVEDQMSASSASDYENISGRFSGLDVDSSDQAGEGLEEEMVTLDQGQLDLFSEAELSAEPEPPSGGQSNPPQEGYYSNSFVRYDPNTNEFVRYDDPELVETDGSMITHRDHDSLFQLGSDSNLSFPGRLAEEQPGELESPVPSSCLDGSTIVGSCGTGVTVSSGGDTLPDLSVSRAGMRKEGVKKKGGIVSRFKKKVLKKQ